MAETHKRSSAALKKLAAFRPCWPFDLVKLSYKTTVHPQHQIKYIPSCRMMWENVSWTWWNQCCTFSILLQEDKSATTPTVRQPKKTASCEASAEECGDGSSLLRNLFCVNIVTVWRVNWKTCAVSAESSTCNAQSRLTRGALGWKKYPNERVAPAVHNRSDWTWIHLEIKKWAHSSIHLP